MDYIPATAALVPTEACRQGSFSSVLLLSGCSFRHARSDGREISIETLRKYNTWCEIKLKTQEPRVPDTKDVNVSRFRKKRLPSRIHRSKARNVFYRTKYSHFRHFDYWSALISLSFPLLPGFLIYDDKIFCAVKHSRQRGYFIFLPHLVPFCNKTCDYATT